MANPITAIVSELEGPVALFCDFDGTLVEIAPSPDAVIVPPGLASQLEDLEDALDGALAIITGRTISDIDTFFPGSRLSVFGSHGAERRVAGATQAPPQNITDKARDITRALERSVGGDSRLLIEPKPAGVALHYRHAPERRQEAGKALEDAIAGMDEFHIIEGKMVFEARVSGVDKGAAVDALMRSEPFSGRTPIFVGDDLTDEDGFRVVQRLGGTGIKVGSGETEAKRRIANVDEVYQLLDALAAASGRASSFNKNEASASEGTFP